MQVQNPLSLSIALDFGLHLQINSLQSFFGSPSLFLKYLITRPNTQRFGLLCKDRDQSKKASENP